MQMGARDDPCIALDVGRYVGLRLSDEGLRFSSKGSMDSKLAIALVP